MPDLFAGVAADATLCLPRPIYRRFGRIFTENGDPANGEIACNLIAMRKLATWTLEGTQPLDLLRLMAMETDDVLFDLELFGASPMITCYLRYVIDPYAVDEFEKYGRMWIPIVNRFGGNHHGYFVPAEGPNNIGFAMFTFASLAEYELYRASSRHDEEARAAYAHARDTRCIVSFERSFLRPIFS